MEKTSLNASDLEKVIPCNMELLGSENPIYIEGESKLKSEIKHA